MMRQEVQKGVGILSGLLLLMTLMPGQAEAQPHTLRAGDLVATCDPQRGVTRLTRAGRVVVTGASTEILGHQFTLTRNVPARDWHWPANRDTCHFAPSVGQLIARIGTQTRHTAAVLLTQPDRYVVRHTYANGVSLVFDHRLTAGDLRLDVTVDNQTQDLFQLHDWLGLDIHFATAPKLFHKMSSYYPAADVYSPVTAAWDEQVGIGLNWIEHACRPVELRVHPYKKKPTQLHVKAWLKNSPIEAGGSARYTLVLRVGGKDWRDLLEPYKKWFNAYFGPIRYRMDFRVKVGAFCSNPALIKPNNPYGYRDGLGQVGWGPFLKHRLGSLRGRNVGQVIFWGITGASRRGVNYRPEFDLMPPAMERTWSRLQGFFAGTGTGFGFFARPNTLAYRQSWSKDADVTFNGLAPDHARMADKRFIRLIQRGASAFYLDTYGSAVGCTPGSARAAVYYLKRLRHLLGPDRLLVTEHGFDAYHVYAAIWPQGEDKLGKKPLGAFARWLMPGSVEVCRVKNIQGAQRAWARGGVPLVNAQDVNDALMALQARFVKADRTSRARPDCQGANPPSVSGSYPYTDRQGTTFSLPALKGKSKAGPKPVESLFR